MGLESLVIAILVVVLLLVLVGLVPLRDDLRPWAYVVIIVLILVWLLRGGLL